MSIESEKLSDILGWEIGRDTARDFALAGIAIWLRKKYEKIENQKIISEHGSWKRDICKELYEEVVKESEAIHKSRME